MARRATDWDGPNRDYECVIDPPSNGRVKWSATYKGAEIARGESQWRWLATRRAEDACRGHVYHLAADRARQRSGDGARWNPYL